MEVQEVGSTKWVKVADNIPDTKFTVRGLEEGKVILLTC